MELILYNTLDNDNVINKTLVKIYTLQIKIKDRNSIINPSIVLSNTKDLYDFTKCNYAYLSGLNRFYFIRDIELIDSKNVRLTLECDVLESFKLDIFNSEVEIIRSIEKGDYINVSGVADLRKEIDIYNSDKSLIGNKNIVLSVIGG